jgi:hypothetical protein
MITNFTNARTYRRTTTRLGYYKMLQEDYCNTWTLQDATKEGHFNIRTKDFL